MKYYDVKFYTHSFIPEYNSVTKFENGMTINSAHQLWVIFIDDKNID